MRNFVKTFSLISFAFIFSFSCRLYWYFWAKDKKSFLLDSYLMLNTNDGYAYATGVKELLNSSISPDFLYAHTALAQFAFFCVKLGFSPFMVELFLPAILGSLIVLPLILFASLIKRPFLGLIAALIACVSCSYYNRTMVGYFDTDMLVVVFAAFCFYLLFRVLTKRELLAVYLLFFCNLLYLFWYPQSFSLILANSCLFLLLAVLKDKKESLYYLCFVLSLVSLLSFSLLIKLSLFAFFLLFLTFKFKSFTSILLYLLASCLVVLTLFLQGAFKELLGQLGFYVFHSTKEGLLFYDVSTTIQEASRVGLLEFMQRISSSSWVFVLSFIGLVWLFKRYPSTVLLLPMTFLGLLSAKAGLRFSIYAVPGFGLGFGAFVCFFLPLFCFKSPLTTKAFKLLFLSMALVPALLHIYEYKVPTVFTNKEASFLKGVNLNDKDFILSWWDYGYLLRYFTNARTLIDGGKHLGKDNFFVSFIFANDEKAASCMAKLAVNASLENKLGLKAIMQEYGFKEPNAFLNALLKGEIKPPFLPKKTGVYLYLPYKMLDILNVVFAFSNIDFKNPGEKESLFYFKSEVASVDLNNIRLLNGVLLSKDLRSISLGEKTLALNSLYKVSSIKERGYQKFTFDESSPLFLIYLEETRDFIVLDLKVLNSSFIQLLLFDNYNKRLFKKSFSSKNAKVFKVL